MIPISGVSLGKLCPEPCGGPRINGEAWVDVVGYRYSSTVRVEGDGIAITRRGRTGVVILSSEPCARPPVGGDICRVLVGYRNSGAVRAKIYAKASPRRKHRWVGILGSEPRG